MGINTDNIRLGQSYWVQIGMHAARIKVIAVATTIGDCWLYEDGGGKETVCTFSQFIGPVS